MQNQWANRNSIICGCETCISDTLLQSDLNRWWLTKLKFLISCILMRNQIGFYKYPRKITLNKIIRYFQTIQTYILDPAMLHHHIIVHIQCQDQKFNNGSAYWKYVLNVLE